MEVFFIVSTFERMEIDDDECDDDPALIVFPVHGRSLSHDDQTAKGPPG